MSYTSKSPLARNGATFNAAKKLKRERDAAAEASAAPPPAASPDEGSLRDQPSANQGCAQMDWRATDAAAVTTGDAALDASTVAPADRTRGAATEGHAPGEAPRARQLPSPRAAQPALAVGVTTGVSALHASTVAPADRTRGAATEGHAPGEAPRARQLPSPRAAQQAPAASAALSQTVASHLLQRYTNRFLSDYNLHLALQLQQAVRLTAAAAARRQDPGLWQSNLPPADIISMSAVSCGDALSVQFKVICSDIVPSTSERAARLLPPSPRSPPPLPSRHSLSLVSTTGEVLLLHSTLTSLFAKAPRP